MKLLWNSKLFGVFYALALTAFTVYAALDTFVIPRAYASVQPSTSATDAAQSERTDHAEAASDQTLQSNADAEKGQSAEEKPENRSGMGRHHRKVSRSAADENGEAASNLVEMGEDESWTYENETVTIKLTKYRENDTDIYVADVTASSPQCLQSAFASDTYGRNITAKTSEIAQSVGAVLAINGDFYGSQSEGYVLRNGVLYRDSAVTGRQDLVIYEDGSVQIISEDEVTARELLDSGAVQVLSFGPALVTEGAIAVTTDQEVGKAKASNPRTAIGVIDDLHYVLVVTDGRTDTSSGLSLYQLAEFMQKLGVKTAYNLDGGGSSTMYFQGKVVNKPTTNGGTISERSVSDIVYIKF